MYKFTHECLMCGAKVETEYPGTGGTPRALNDRDGIGMCIVWGKNKVPLVLVHDCGEGTKGLALARTFKEV